MENFRKYFVNTMILPEPMMRQSEAAQDRLEELLYRNREEELTAEEQAELDTYGHLNHLMIRLKARALGGKNLLEQSP